MVSALGVTMMLCGAAMAANGFSAVPANGGEGSVLHQIYSAIYIGCGAITIACSLVAIGVGNLEQRQR